MSQQIDNYLRGLVEIQPERTAPDRMAWPQALVCVVAVSLLSWVPLIAGAIAVAAIFG